MHARSSLHLRSVASLWIAAALSACSSTPEPTPSGGASADSQSSGSEYADTRPAAPTADSGSCALTPVYFSYDSNELDSAARAALAHNAECIQRSGAARASVVGMTDPRGTDEYNMALGERRARSTTKYLTALGVEETNLTPRSAGEEYASGADEAGWARDRRADFTSE